MRVNKIKQFLNSTDGIQPWIDALVHCKEKKKALEVALGEAVLIFTQREDTQVTTSTSKFRFDPGVPIINGAGFLPAASIGISGGTETDFFLMATLDS